MQSHLLPTTAVARSQRPSHEAGGGAATPLSQLVGGALALYEGADLPAGELALLAAVGLHGGETLRVRQGGDSCVIQVGPTRLALSGAAARRIMVRPLGAHHDG